MSTRPVDRRAQILLAAEEMLGIRGFNAFSHRDLAEAVEVKLSSVHYHFPTKQDLGLALIEDYTTTVDEFLVSLEPLAVPERLARFAALFSDNLARGGRWCLAGSLASDRASLNEQLRDEVKDFFVMVEAWFTKQALVLNPALDQARARGNAQSAIALMEGAMLLARIQDEPQRITQAGRLLETVLASASS